MDLLGEWLVSVDLAVEEFTLSNRIYHQMSRTSLAPRTRTLIIIFHCVILIRPIMWLVAGLRYSMTLERMITVA